MADLGAGGPESGSGPRYEACVAALKQWRDGLVREGKLPLGGLKDTDLHRAITRGRREEKGVSNVLPATYRRFSADIVEIIKQVDSEVLKRLGPPQPSAAPAPSAHAPRPAIPMPATGSTPVAPPASPTPTPAAASPAQPEAANSFGPLVDPGPAPSRPPAPTPPSPDRQAQLARIAAQFVPMDYSEERGEPGALKAALSSGSVTLSWLGATDLTGGSVYRVVSTDDYPGYAPEFAELINITQELSAVDTREFTSAVRVYQVWRNSGMTPTDAMASQPRLHAQSTVVVPIQHLSLQEDGGRVVGQWSVFPGISRVHVHRIPLERAAQAGNDAQYEIETATPNLSGFVDREAVRGKKYLYRFFAEASIDGLVRLSTAVGQVLAVPAILKPVEDLVVMSHGDASHQQFELRWTNPDAGRVVVYRTPTGPTAGLENETRDEATLEGFGLKMDLRLRHPTQSDGNGTTAMGDVPTPDRWDRVYFTPVTLLDGKARVGRTVSKVVIGEVDHPVVVERTDHQVIKFGWPGEAAAVAVSIGPPGKEATVPAEGPNYQEISRDHYRRLGGLQFPHRLPMDGCSVHLAGISFVGGARIYGAAAVTSYAGLLRLSYSVDVKRSLVHNPNQAIIRVWGERELNSSPPFVLVHHPERLPLFVGDGDALPVTLDVDEVSEPRRQFSPPRLGTNPGTAAFRANVRGRTGFVRVFVDVPPEMLRKVALIDPPIATLMLRG